MQRYGFLSIITGLAAIATAAPTSTEHTLGESFSVERLLNSEHARNGMAAKQKAFKKFGWKMHNKHESQKIRFDEDVALSFASKKTTTGQSGRVQAIPENSYAEYISQVTIGGQTLRLDFDTGSSDLWVFSTYLSDQTIGEHTAFNPNESSTFNSLDGYSWYIMYGDGSGAEGVVGTDTVIIGGASVKSQAVELATSLSEEFVQDVYSDGILGLGFSIINDVNPVPQKTFFENIMSKLKLPLFAVDLEEDGSGFFQFGAIDSTKYKGVLSKVPVDNSNGYWEFQSPSFAVNGTKALNIGSSPAIADTGTSLIIVDDSVAENYYTHVSGARYSYYYGGFIFPCEETLPSFGMSLGGKYMATISGLLLNYAQISNHWCYGGVQANEGYPLQIYGDLLFRSEFVIFENHKDFQGLAIAPKR